MGLFYRTTINLVPLIKISFVVFSNRGLVAQLNSHCLTLFGLVPFSNDDSIVSNEDDPVIISKMIILRVGSLHHNTVHIYIPS